MTKDELIEFLRENLKVTVNHEAENWNSSAIIKVGLVLCDETIHEEYTYVFN